jgi:hypothetical protein
MPDIQFQDKLIAFVDIVGFKALVSGAESDTGQLTLPEIREATQLLGTEADCKRMIERGPNLCPAAPRLTKHVSFKLTQVSDCVVVSVEVSPAGAITLLNHCWVASLRLMQLGLMCRGYITRGKLYHEGSEIIGSGYSDAYAKAERGVTVFKQSADERGTPFIEVDSEVVKYVDTCGDSCVKEMASRMMKSDGKLTALFPFKRLGHSFIVSGLEQLGLKFEPDKAHRQVDNMRKIIHQTKERVASFVKGADASVLSKAEHYQRMLDVQVVVCDKQDDNIEIFRRG